MVTKERNLFQAPDKSVLVLLYSLKPSHFIYLCIFFLQSSFSSVLSALSIKINTILTVQVLTLLLVLYLNISQKHMK